MSNELEISLTDDKNVNSPVNISVDINNNQTVYKDFNNTFGINIHDNEQSINLAYNPDEKVKEVTYKTKI